MGEQILSVVINLISSAVYDLIKGMGSNLLLRKSDKTSLKDVTEQVQAMTAERIDESKYSETGQKYYSEYKKVLGIITEEDADFELLREAFRLIQKKPELINMDAGIFPLLLIRAPETQKEKLKCNVINSIRTFRFEHDFKMEEKIRFIESL